MGTALQTVLQSTSTPQSSTFLLLPRWPSRSARTTMSSVRHSSTNRSTWSSTPAMSTSPSPLTSTVSTRRCQASPASSGSLLISSTTTGEPCRVPGQAWGQGGAAGHQQAQQDGVGHSPGGDDCSAGDSEDGDLHPAGPAGRGRREEGLPPGGLHPEAVGGEEGGDHQVYRRLLD